MDLCTKTAALDLRIRAIPCTIFGPFSRLMPPTMFQCEYRPIKLEPSNEYPSYADQVPMTSHDSGLRLFAERARRTRLPAHVEKPYAAYGSPPYVHADTPDALWSPPSASASASFSISPSHSSPLDSPNGSVASDVSRFSRSPTAAAATSTGRRSPLKRCESSGEYASPAGAEERSSMSAAKKPKATGPIDKGSEAYRLKRQKNNEAAKRSRDHKKEREEALHAELEQARITIRFLKMVIELGTHKLPVCIRKDMGALDHSPLIFTPRMTTLMRALTELSETRPLRDATMYDVRAFCKGPL